MMIFTIKYKLHGDNHNQQNLLNACLSSFNDDGTLLYRDMDDDDNFLIIEFEWDRSWHYILNNFDNTNLAIIENDELQIFEFISIEQNDNDSDN